MQKEFLILVVVYKVDLEKSSTISSLKKNKEHLHNSKILVWDNSPNKSDKIESIKKEFNHFEYIHTGDNSSLSYIYNQTIHTNNNFNYMIILDQDSSFTEKYFISINSAIKNNKDINLFLPIVKSGATIVSPGDYKIFKGSYWKREQYGIIESKNKLAINSGMIINFDYLKNSFKGYDERLRFYGTDTYFMIFYMKKNKNLFVIDYILEHDSALLKKDGNIDDVIDREYQLMLGWLRVNSSSKLKLILTYIYFIFKIIKISIQHRTIKLLVRICK